MIKSLIFTAFLLFTLCLTATAQKEVNNSTSRWVENDGSTELSVTSRNDVRFNDDYTDVVSVSSDGFLEVRERRGGLTRELKIVVGASGQLVRTYTVNGEARAFDAEGKNWLSKILAEAVRKGFDARARAARLVRRGGPAAIINEIPRLEGDYTKRVYLEEAVKSGNPDASALRQILNLTARDISSDYEKATLLINTVSVAAAQRSTLEAFFSVVDTIESDYEHARVLKAFLKANPGDKEIIMRTLGSAGKISSDYEKATLLIDATGASPTDRNALDDYFAAANSIKSDYERGRVLKSILRANPADKEILILTLGSASKMSSDYEKANVLMQVGRSSVQDDSVRTALLNAAKTISSDYERGRVLNTIYLKDIK